MTELDQVWAQMLGKEVENAAVSGRHDLADYLRLKASNDAIRAAGVAWLFDSVTEIAGLAMRNHSAITIEREEPHNFAHGTSNMTGSLLRVRHGVRCLTVEAGWARVPSDGIMRKGSLAFARITHFGIPKADAELRLVHATSLPTWLDEDSKPADITSLGHHFNILLAK